jgi:PAS domain S-box-containing protein
MRSQPYRSYWAVVAGLGAYAVFTAVLICTNWGGSKITWLLSNWNPVPAEFILLGLLLSLLRRMPPGRRRFGWTLIVWALLAETFGNILRDYPDEPIPGILENCADALFLSGLALTIAALAAFFTALGGSFRSRRVWLDATVLAVVIGVTSSLFLVSPQIAAGGKGLHPLIAASYVSLDGAIMVMIALLVIQIMDWRAERALLMLIIALTIGVLCDAGWVAARAREQFDLDSWVTVGGYGLVCALLAASAEFERRRTSQPPEDTAKSEPNVSGFLPILAVLLALAALMAEKANPHGLRGAVLVSAVIACAILVLARQLGARYEIRTLYRTLAAKEAESKLTELVRRSSDLIAVVNSQRRLVYVSPASEKILGVPQQALQFTSAARLLGPDNESRLDSFLTDVETRHASNAEMEAVIATAAGVNRTLFVVGSDQTQNPAIAGITLTLRDVTEQRRLEREVLEIAAREQQRLSSEIHEGLGQELTGISLLLKSLETETRRDPTALPGFLKVVVGHVNRTIDTARSLATGLAPMQIARGSLDIALANLVAEARERFSLRANLKINLKSAEIGAAEADHFYRIAREAINNAARHGSCKIIDVDLRREENRFVLTVSDDGVGIEHGTLAGSGLGLRMIAYRARVMGGAMHVGTSAAGGAQISVSAPMAAQISQHPGAAEFRRGNISIN